MKSIYTKVFVGAAALMMLSCTDTSEMVPYNLTTHTDFGQMVVASGVVGSVHTDSSTAVTEGVKQSYIHFLTQDGYSTRVYAYEVNMATPSIDLKVCTANDYNSTMYSKQVLSEQAKLVESAGNTVIGGINGDYFVSSGKPNGVLVKDGKIIKKYSTKATWTYFGITKDKQAVIGDEADLAANSMDNLRDAIGGKDWLVRGGNIMPQTVPTREAKTAIGVTSAGKVVMFVVDGGLFNYSNGLILADVAKIMQQLGCTDAISLSSGRSSTFMSRVNNLIALRNIPSNNMVEDPISNGLLIIKK